VIAGKQVKNVLELRVKINISDLDFISEDTSELDVANMGVLDQKVNMEGDIKVGEAISDHEIFVGNNRGELPKKFCIAFESYQGS
jgi:hypothetical protein